MRRTTILILVAVSAVALACGSGSKSGGSAAKSPASLAGMNQPVRDGKFEFTVSGVQCGVTKVGTDVLNKTAQGQFCEIAVTVKNIGKEAQTFDGSAQKARDAGGTEYSNDAVAETYANSASQTFLEQINPGNQVKGMLVFDVPTNVKLARLRLHDSPFSNGVDVALG